MKLLFIKSLSHQNLLIYSLFLLIALAGILVGRSVEKDHSFVRVWEFSNILLLLIGIPFLFLQKNAGLPDLLEGTVTHRGRFLYPAIAGLAFGLLDVIVWKIILHPQPYTELPPFLQPFPYSIFLYLLK